MAAPPTKRPPPIITHAPQGLRGGRPPHDPRRLRSIAVTIGLVWAAALFGAVLEDALFDPCRNAEPGDQNTSGNRCGGAHHTGVSHGGSGFGLSHFFYGGGGQQHSATFGGFGATGESGAHGGGFGGGHGGGE